jgi:predicted AlkP superfamily phosphohydrolase/phosphomutase/tetratricopeptide (TPR) repeat protein
MASKKRNKTLLIGWDAADWNVVNPLMKKGLVPTLEGLIKNGSYGKIATLNPPLSPILWTSIATGKRAYVHGICGFTEVSEDQKSVQAVRGSSRKAAAFWDIFDKHNIKSNIVGWWPSHPAEPINGTMISNFYGMCNTPFGEKWPILDDTVYPEGLSDLMAELRLHPGELTPAMLKPFFPNSEDLLSDNDEVLRSVMKILGHACSVHNAATWLIENTEWDCTAVYYDAIDHFSHLAMKFHPPKLEGVSDEDFKNYNYIIEAAYRFHDMMLDRLLQLAGSDVNVILVSDHGFESGNNRMLALPEQPAAPALEHSPYGVLICSGPDFKSNEKIYGSSLLDICPTLLQLYNIPKGKDMEGQVLKEALKNEHVLEPIDSHEVKNKVFGLKSSSGFDNTALKQLIDIGYLDNSVLGENATTQTLIENDFYLAQSYLDGGKLNEAIRVMEKATSHKNAEVRHTSFLCKLYLANSDWDNFLKILKQLDESKTSTQELDFLKAQYNFATQNFHKALVLFEKISRTSTSAALHHLIAKTYLKLGVYKSAEQYFKSSLSLNKDIAQNWTELAKLHIHKNKFEEALDLLLDSLDYIFKNPETHKLIGVCLIKLEHFEEAANALELSLSQNEQQLEVLELLNNLYRTQLKKPDLIRSFQKKEPKIIVSGLPRSGTSLVMQLLDAGGISVFTDEKRPSDENNPNGYFEFESLTNPNAYFELFKSKDSSAFKITYPLVQELPDAFHYRVIAIERNLQTVIHSQNKMKGSTNDSLDFNLATGLNQIREACDSWLLNQTNISLLKLNYENLLANPAQEIEKICVFLDKDLNQEKMLKCIDYNLNRSQH